METRARLTIAYIIMLLIGVFAISFLGESLLSSREQDKGAISSDYLKKLSEENRETRMDNNERLYGKIVERKKEAVKSVVNLDNEIKIKKEPEPEIKIDIETIISRTVMYEAPPFEKYPLSIQAIYKGKGWLFYSNQLKSQRIIISPEKLANANGRTLRDPVYHGEYLVVLVHEQYAKILK